MQAQSYPEMCPVTKRHVMNDGRRGQYYKMRVYEIRVILNGASDNLGITHKRLYYEKSDIRGQYYLVSDIRTAK